MGALHSVVLSGVSNILFRELEACGFVLAPYSCLSFIKAQTVFGSADHIDQELKPNAL